MTAAPLEVVSSNPGEECQQGLAYLLSSSVITRVEETVGSSECEQRQQRSGFPFLGIDELALGNLGRRRQRNRRGLARYLGAKAEEGALL